MLGRIKNVQPTQYGFITGEDGTDYFFHMSSYTGDWDYLRKISPPSNKRGPLVQFKAIEHHKGLRAVNVELLGG